ncbi:hypothetical protein [Desulfosporosinus sp. FKA]|uniref:hypothetical protein n=1 Tax=Desulfosporosinus sp. FKA TaxID=1969834 RepID=UPI000B4A3AC4|nr:hypothetical protein [Desulfosporosinus sp. FKA]
MNRIIGSNLELLATITEEQWKNTLETDYPGATTPFLISEDYEKLLASLPRLIRNVLFERAGAENFSQLSESLPQGFVQDIWSIRLLKEFLGRRKRNVVVESVRENLEASTFINTVTSARDDKQALLALLLTTELSLEDLKNCLYLSNYDTYSYQDFVLLTNNEGISDPLILAELRQVQATGVPNGNVSTELVETILRQFEIANNTNLNSTCRKVLIYNNEVIIYILRESQRNGLRTFNEFIVGMNADWLVLRFSSDFRFLKVRAVEAVKPVVYSTIAQKIVESLIRPLSAYYVPRSDSNSDDTVNDFVQRIISEAIPNVRMAEIELGNTPFQGRPSIIIKKDSGPIMLGDTLTDNRNGLAFVDIIPASQVRKFKIVYDLNSKNHIFTIFLTRIVNGTYVHISGQGGGVRKRQALIDYLRQETDLRIIEKLSKEYSL